MRTERERLDRIDTAIDQLQAQLKELREDVLQLKARMLADAEAPAKAAKPKAATRKKTEKAEKAE